MKSYVGPKTEEVAALRLLLPYMVSDPYQGQFGPDLQQFAPRGIFNEALYESLIPLLYNADINDLDTYVSIDNLLNAAFRASSVDTNLAYRREEDDVGRYMYAPQLAHLLLVTLEKEEGKNRNESAEETKIEALKDSEEAKTETVVESQIDLFERLVTNMAPMASTQHENDPANFSRHNVSTPPTRTPLTTPRYNMKPIASSQPHDESPILSTINVSTSSTRTPHYEPPPFDFCLRC